MSSSLIKSLERVTVTEENINEIREQISPYDQRAEIEVGQTITHYAHAEFNSQATYVTIFHDTGRAGWCEGGDSSWGEWDEATEEITPDDSDIPQMNRYAEPIEDEEDCEDEEGETLAQADEHAGIWE